MSDREKNIRTGSGNSVAIVRNPYDVTTGDQSQSVDQERIMQIWEKFFENAFKRFLHDDNDNDADYRSYESEYHSGAYQTNKKNKNQSSSNKAKNTVHNSKNVYASSSADDKRSSHTERNAKRDSHKEYSYHSNHKSSYWDEDDEIENFKKTSMHAAAVDRPVRNRLLCDPSPLEGDAMAAGPCTHDPHTAAALAGLCRSG